MKLEQLQKLREVREMKAEQASAALASARRAQAHWSEEQRKWSQVCQQIKSLGGAVIQEVMDEAKDIDDPFLVYQRIQEALRRQRQAELHAQHSRDHARRSLVEANGNLSSSVENMNLAEGRKQATGQLVDKVAATETKREEAMAEDLALDDFAVRQGMAAKSR